MGISWEKAPRWATSVGHNGGSHAWLSNEGYCFFGLNNPPCHPYSFNTYEKTKFTIVEQRPVVWNGEGLPPVGKSVCEYRGAHQYDVWTVVNIFAEWGEGSRKVVFVDFGDLDGWRVESDPERFRPIRTAEQIAADEREKDIADMVEALGCDPEASKTAEFIRCGILYDAGWRKQDSE